MMRFTIPIILSLAAATNAYYPLLPVPGFYTAASDAQIRFALENKYDDTGPGAKEPEYAYRTYATLDEAILGYLDDPDTKLPEHEKERAVSTISKNPSYLDYKPFKPDQEFKRHYPKTVEEYTGYNQEKQQGSELSKPRPAEVYKGYRLPQSQLVLTKIGANSPKKYRFPSRPIPNNGLFKQLEANGETSEPYRLTVKKPVRQPTSASNNNDSDLLDAQQQYNTHPKYTYSYGVHVPDTGDTKSAQETREGGTVRGYYSFRDPDGKQRTVHYTADDSHGFQATVERE